MTNKDIEEQLIKDIAVAIERDETRKMLKIKYGKSVLKKEYVKAQNIKSQIEKREKDIADRYIKEVSVQQFQLHRLMDKFEPKDKEEIVLLTNGVISLCDIIETFVMDINELLKKADPDCRIESFDSLIAVGAEAKKQMLYMSRTTSILYQEEFANHADKIEEMFRNKMRQMVRRVNQKELKLKMDECKNEKCKDETK